MLPADVKVLTDLVGVARDAVELRRWMYDLHYTAIATTGPCRPAPAWRPETSDRYLDFWRIHTRVVDPATPGARTWRIVAGQPPRNLALDEPPGLVELADAGDALLRAGSTRAALAAFTRAHDQAPSLALPFIRSAACRLALGDPRGAVADCLRAVARAGPGPVVLDRLGEAYAAAGIPGRSAAAFEQAAGLDDDAGAGRWLKAARALEAAGHVPAAREAARRAHQREPGNREARELAARLGAP